MTLRLIALSWVLGIAGTASAQDVPEAYAAASYAHVTFEADVGVVLSRSDGHGGWEALGISPCDLALPPGAIDLALSHANRPPVRIPIALDLTDGARLVGHYESRQTYRELGVGILFGTIVGVLIGIAIGVGGFVAGSLDVGLGGLIAGASVGVVGGATGIALATLDDIATIEIL